MLEDSAAKVLCVGAQYVAAVAEMMRHEGERLSHGDSPGRH